MTDWNRVAAAVLAKCASKDPFFPKPSAALAIGWGEEFECWNLTVDQLIAGVARAYHDHGNGFRPLPKDIVDAARVERREQDEKNGPSAEYQALCESKYISYEESLALSRERVDRVTDAAEAIRAVLEDDGQPVDPATRCTIHQEAM